MCIQHPPKTLRHGSRLEHGEAHQQDHSAWSRRDFLSTLGVAAGSAVMMGGIPVQAVASPSLMQHLRHAPSDRVLVLVQLEGGNDGLNTIIPIENDRYYQVRPNVSIAKTSSLQISDEVGFHPEMTDIHGMYGDGKMAILRGVGYPEQDLSHFRSTDIWMTASETSTYLNSGWVGRTAESMGDKFDESLPYPLAVQLGWGDPLLGQGEARTLGMAINNPELFQRLADVGKLFDEEAVSANPYGAEISFLRSVANDAFRYAGAIQDASIAGRNRVGYAFDNDLSQNLAIVAKLIKGNLGARIYHVRLGGFDTHADQSDWHGTLLRYLSEAVGDFQADLEADGWQDKVLTMTFSEFGRRVEENASYGTDHGSSAPLFLFGTTVNGGLYGEAPDLVNLDHAGNVPFQVNFRNVYSTVLQDWFGISQESVTEIIGEQYDSLGFIASPITVDTVGERPPEGFDLATNYPNPFTSETTIAYTLEEPAEVALEVFDVRGRLVRTLANHHHAAGTHRVTFTADRLPNGVYFYHLRLPNGQKLTRQMVLIK